jgi:CRP-like cAMP-binding protein
VLMGTTLGHFDPALFPNQEDFDIDRYAEPRNEHRQPGAYAPFGVGAHTCLSQGAVEAILMMGVATLLRTVQLELSPADYKLRTVSNPVPGPETGFTIRVRQQRAVNMPTVASAPPAITLDELAELLPALKAPQAARLAANLKPRSYSAGAEIIRENDPADHFYVLLEGEVAVLKHTVEGSDTEVSQLQSPNYFGEIGLLYGVPRTATVRAVGPVRLLALDREMFTDIVAEADLTSAEIAQFVRQRYIGAHLAASLPVLAADQLHKLTGSTTLVRYPAGTAIIQQGEPADSFYVIARGQVEVTNHHPGGREILLAQRGPGEFFGEAGLLQGRPRTATVRASPAGEVELLEIKRQAFDELMAGSPAASETIAMRMVERLNTLLQEDEPTEPASIT